MFAQYTKDLNFSGALVGPNLAQGSYNTVLGGTGNFSLKCIDLEGNTVTAGAFIYIDTRIPTQSDVDKSTPPACSDDFVSPAPGNGPGSGPTSSTTCTTPGSTCQSGTFCANGATKVGSCNSGLGSCCMTGGTRADAGGPSGSAGNASSSNSAYFNPLKFDSVEGVLTGVITQLRNIIVILSIIFIIIGAVMYILSAGNESRMNTAKGAITAALIGLTLAIAAPAFLKEIASILGWTNITDASNTIQGAQTFSQIASKVLDFLLSIVGIIGIIMLVFGGFTYLASAGDENKAETGKKIVTYAIIAIALALSALVLVTQVAKLFG